MKFLKFVALLLLFSPGYGAEALLRSSEAWLLTKLWLRGLNQRKGLRSEDATNSIRVPPADAYVTQWRDHFRPSDYTTWQQAYFINDSYWKPGSDAPIFLCTGGESPPKTRSMVVGDRDCSDAVLMLEDKGALMFGLEHRYYGCHNFSACPADALLDADPMRWLNVDQALADVATFIEAMKKKYNLSDKNKWVTFGGSYPGTVSAWSRLKYPNHVYASVSSSAPVLAQYDFFEFLDHAGENAAISSIGGSEACRTALTAGHARVGDMMKTGQGRQSLATTFDLPSAAWLESSANRLDFAGWGVAYYEVQSNDPVCPDYACNVESFCSELLGGAEAVTTDDAVKNLAKIRAGQRDSWAPWLVVDYNASSVYKPIPFVEMRFAWWTLWNYQVCTEFGWLFSCAKGSDCPFTQDLGNFEDQQAMCKGLFGVMPAGNKAAIAATNRYFGGKQMEATRVFSVNGQADPWSEMAITESLGDQMPAHVALGASHHAWTYPPKPTDQESLKATRKLIRKVVFNWLCEGPCTDCVRTNMTWIDISRRKLLFASSRKACADCCVF